VSNKIIYFKNKILKKIEGIFVVVLFSLKLRSLWSLNRNQFNHLLVNFSMPHDTFVVNRQMIVAVHGTYNNFNTAFEYHTASNAAKVSSVNWT